MNSNKDFIQKVADLAQAEWKENGVILPSVTIAQAILESGWGKSGLTVKGNALFGIKAGTSWKGKRLAMNTWEVYDGKRVDIVDAFRAYDSWEASVADHSDFLRSLSRYKAIVGNTDAEEVCRLLQKAGYATAPNYADSLIKLIRQYDLTEYDRINGWYKDGAYWVYFRDAKIVKKQWVEDAGYWYWLDWQGRMLTGLQEINGELYMLNPRRWKDIPMGACIITDKNGVIKKG